MNGATTLPSHGYAGPESLETSVAVDLDRICPACQGRSVEWSDQWRDWNVRYDAAKKDATERGALDQENGKWLDPTLRALEEEMEHLGPEEIPCGECEGVGAVLTNEGRTLVAFIRKHMEVPR